MNNIITKIYNKISQIIFCHKIYEFCGHVFCRVALIYWKFRDIICKPKAEAILFVAHPDDDTLFFHSFIKENKPYIVLLFTGWSLIRLFDFFKVMKHYNVRYRVYDTVSANAYNDNSKRKVVESHINKCLQIKKFNICVTHNSTGEYGHPTHKLVYEIVKKIGENQIPILCPVDKQYILNYPLDSKLIDEKEQIFNNFYKSEAWVIQQYSDWVQNEKLMPLS